MKMYWAYRPSLVTKDMAEFTETEAIFNAKSKLGISESILGRAWLVQRLDRVVDAYYLIVFGEGEAAIAVAAIDAQIGVVQASALLSGGGSPLNIDAEQAIAIARLGGPVQARLVWKPCRASLSPLYPFWELRTTEETVYIDQQGTVWRDLEPAGPGG